MRTIYAVSPKHEMIMMMMGRHRKKRQQQQQKRDSSHFTAVEMKLSIKMDYVRIAAACSFLHYKSVIKCASDG